MLIARALPPQLSSTLEHASSGQVFLEQRKEVLSSGRD